jgi:hypothetical protein
VRGCFPQCLVNGISARNTVRLIIKRDAIIVDPSGGPIIETNINAAIAKASAGDEILVHSGTYHGTVEVDKPLTPTGVNNGAGVPVVDGDNHWDIAIHAGNVIVQNFNATNAMGGIPILGEYNSGVYNNLIRNNTIFNSTSDFIDIDNSDNNIILDNTIIGGINGYAQGGYSLEVRRTQSRARK